MISNKPEYWNIEIERGILVTKRSHQISDLINPLWYNDLIKPVSEEETLPLTNPSSSISFGRNRTYDIDYDIDGVKSNFLNRRLPHIAKVISDSKYILDFEEDWDDEGANATNLDTYNRAINFVRDYSIQIFMSAEPRIKISAPSIEILRDGSVAVNWETKKASFLIVFDISNDKISYCYGKNKVNGIPFKTGVENNNDVDEIVASWMRKNLIA